uniref:NADH-ubiquinone oxidoreductase chain 6 n=1 Tax=Tricholepidion gertschi TaxID=89825 RepID=Q85QR7_9INSE|nr:NADH dehydrogenase subunit 6 [Tricholepidion gertschi]AAO40213.1 NADH dehydrogenase subunit 6 [Tricholepidion gertschi]
MTYQLMIMYMSMFISVLITQINHPLAMGLTIIIQTILICLITGMMLPSFWFSYILFLVFLGGMLVVFIYVSTLASNETFKTSPKMLITTAILLIITTMVTMISDNSLLSWTTSLQESMTMNTDTKILPLSTMKLYMTSVSPITLMMISYMFLTLIAVTKITNIFKGPLRSMK